MDQVVHGYGTTTEMAHRAMQHSQEGLSALATRHVIMPVAKWKKRSATANLPTGSKT